LDTNGNELEKKAVLVPQLGHPKLTVAIALPVGISGVYSLTNLNVLSSQGTQHTKAIQV